VLAAAASLAATGVAGCLDAASGNAADLGGNGTTTAGRSTDGGADTQTGASDAALPTRDAALHVPDDAKRLRENVVSGGPGKDGIPSVDDPSFEPVDEVGDRLANNAPVFGVEVDGEAKAYPQYVLVWHEIANDVVGDVPIAMTYCPLTGTVLAFERGGVEFGVSGNLVNSNLVMYDRVTDSRWPQVLGTAIEGEHQGSSLREHPTTWTTWTAWKAAHPDGLVLTEDTGSVRSYGRDPYGDYNPKRGYYQNDSFLFAPSRESDLLAPKRVVYGVRSTDGAFAVKESLLSNERVVTGSAGSTPVVVAFDRALGAGVAYANPDDVAVEPVDDGYRVDGESRPARDLGLERLPGFDAMFFAWYAFYPDSEFVLDASDATAPREAIDSNEGRTR